MKEYDMEEKNPYEILEKLGPREHLDEFKENKFWEYFLEEMQEEAECILKTAIQSESWDALVQRKAVLNFIQVGVIGFINKLEYLYEQQAQEKNS